MLLVPKKTVSSAAVSLRELTGSSNLRSRRYGLMLKFL